MRMKILAFIVFLLVLPLLTSAMTSSKNVKQYQGAVEAVSYDFGTTDYSLFYNSAGIGMSSHFYTVDLTGEMTEVNLKRADAVIYEDVEVLLIKPNFKNQLSGLVSENQVIVLSSKEQYPRIIAIGSVLTEKSNAISQSVDIWRSSIAYKAPIKNENLI